MNLLDVHAHVLPELRKPSKLEVACGWPETQDAGGVRRVTRNGRLLRELRPVAWDLTARLEAMDREGIARQVVSPAPFTFLYDAAAVLTAEFAAHLNERIAALCAQAPERLIGFGSVPLQDTDRAVDELDHAITRLGLAGIEIGSNAGRLQLHDPELDAFFSAAEDLDVPLFLHPGPLDRLERTGHNGLAFALARPVETELAIGSLVHGGVLERHTRLRICVSHGGGGVPALAGRWQAGWERRTPGIRIGSVDPRSLLARLWADTLTYDPNTLPLVAKTFGTDHLVLGTDFPFAAQESPPGTAIATASAQGLVDIPRWEQVLSTNAMSFLYGPRTTNELSAGSRIDSPTTAGS